MKMTKKIAALACTALVAVTTLTACDHNDIARVQEAAHTATQASKQVRDTGKTLNEVQEGLADAGSSGMSSGISDSDPAPAPAPGAPADGPMAVPAEFTNNRVVVVDQCDLSPEPVEPNVKVNVGANGREAWVYTDQYGRVALLLAPDVTLQTKDEERDNGRLCSGVARIPFTGKKYGNDMGHMLADSLGGASNRYAGTAQNARVNRHLAQAQFEKRIRNAGGATNFRYEVHYKTPQDRVPDSYTVTFTRKADGVTENLTFANRP